MSTRNNLLKNSLLFVHYTGISYADLSIINNAIRSINSNIKDINGDIGTINVKQDQLETELDKLVNAFTEFVEADKKHKALQLAETRVGNLKQDLQIKFGYYAEVRRMATGILQGVDTGIVSDDTLRFTTEEVMIKAPGYWLAPALVTIASWIRNDKNNSENALNESFKRDDYKTTLFFMLIMRRLSRHEASLKWLERYFMHQNAHHLDREFIIILEAVTTGVFPPASRNLMMKYVKSWLNQLSQTGNFIDEQKRQWIKFFEASTPSLNETYTLLKKFASNYNDLEYSLRKANTYWVMYEHFSNVISSSADLSKAVKMQLDEILTLLVTNFDDEELPLQKQVRLNQLIIEMDGDKDAAQAKMDVEEHNFDEKVDFLQMLTNAAFNPQMAGATKATQTLAVSISQPWIIEAHDTFTAKNRNTIPQSIDLAIDGFKVSTKNGSDENECLQKQEIYYESLLNVELNKLSYPTAYIILGAFICLFSLWPFYYLFTNSDTELGYGYLLIGLFLILIGGYLIWSSIRNFNSDKQKLKENIEERKIKAKEVLRGCIAEVVDYRRAYAKEDTMAEALRDLLASITPEDFSSVSRGTARNLVQL